MRYHDAPNDSWGVKVWKKWLWWPLMDMSLALREVNQHPNAQCVLVMSRVEEFEIRLVMFRRRYSMAQKSKKETWQTDWVHVELTPEQKGEYRAWDMENEDVMELLGGLLSGGYKLTCNYNTTNSTYQASLICNGEKDTNTGKGVSGYAALLNDAIRVVVYKTTVVLPDNWADYQPPGGNDIG